MNKIFLSVLTVLSVGFTAAHAAQEVQITALPSTPIVFTNDMTYIDGSGNSVTVKAPWISFSVHINNLTTDNLSIIGVHTEVTGKDVDGNDVTTTLDLTPASYSYKNTTATCTYGDFGQFIAGGSTTGNTGFNDRNLYLTPAAGSSYGCAAGDVVFYVGGLPKMAGSTSSINYQVKIQPLGWFGDLNSPKSRFDQFIVISTQ